MYPLVVRHLLLPAHELAVGRRTLAYLRDLERTQWWSMERLRALQETKLRRLLAHAASRCPFYRRRIEAARIDPERIALCDLRLLPTLSKDDIRKHGREMIDPEVEGGLQRFSTGGSTGDPLIFQVDRRRQAADQAARARSRRWFGIDLGERELYLWGSPIEVGAQDRFKLVRDRLMNHRLLDAFNMTPRTMSRYIKTMRRFDPVHIFGYPSSLARLLRHAERTGAPPPNRSLKAVFTTGELLDRQDRAVLEEHFRTPVADGYGSREAGFIAHQCPFGAYHLTMESLIVELVDVEGSPVGGDRAGEVTVTHLDAFGMPFIRYRTGDVARWSDEVCPCGRGLESLEVIEGRQADMLRTADGGYAHALSVIYVLREEPGIRRFKVVQQRNLDLDVAIVSDDSFDRRRREEARRQLRRRIGGGIEVRFNPVDEIPPEASGKYRCVSSHAGRVSQARKSRLR